MTREATTLRFNTNAAFSSPRQGLPARSARPSSTFRCDDSHAVRAAPSALLRKRYYSHAAPGGECKASAQPVMRHPAPDTAARGVPAAPARRPRALRADPSVQTPLCRPCSRPPLRPAHPSVYRLGNSTASLTSENEFLTSHFSLPPASQRGDPVFFLHKHVRCLGSEPHGTLIQDS